MTTENALARMSAMTRQIADAISDLRSCKRHTCTVEQHDDNLHIAVSGDEDNTATHGTTRGAIEAVVSLCVDDSRLGEAMRGINHSGTFASVVVSGYTLADACNAISANSAG